MLFTRTYNFRTNLSVEEIKRRLVNQHVKVHELDFEVSEKKHMIKIIPHAESLTKIKTLPITHIKMKGLGNGSTKVRVYAKPRKIDAGGPYMIVIFCAFCVIGASILYLVNRNDSLVPSLVLLGIALIVFTTFWLRMESGYYDYIRKIRGFVKGRLATAI